MMVSNEHDDMPDGFKAFAWAEHGPDAYAVAPATPIQLADGVTIPADALIGVFGYDEARDIATAVAHHGRVIALAGELDSARAWPEDAARTAEAVQAEIDELLADEPGILRGLAVLARRHLKAVAR